MTLRQSCFLPCEATLLCRSYLPVNIGMWSGTPVCDAMHRPRWSSSNEQETTAADKSLAWPNPRRPRSFTEVI